MKSFIISILIFALLLSGIIINCFYVSYFSDELAAFAERFPGDRLPDNSDAIEELKVFWHKNEFFIMLTNDHSRVHEVYHHIQNMEAALISENFTLYINSRLAIADAAKGFREFDSFSLIGVL